MSKKKQETKPEETKRAYVWPKEAIDWNALFAAAGHDHWRTLRVTIQFNDKLCAGKPARLDVAKAMLAARGLEDKIEAAPVEDPARQEHADEVAELESKCEFHHRPDRPGIWLPANNVKAMLKENWGVLGLRVEHRGSRGALAEGVFVFSDDPKDPEWIYLGENPDGEDQGVVHAMTAAGPRTSIKRKDYVERKTISFLVKISAAIQDKLPPDGLARVLYHAQFHGIGADRSQGRGTFKVTNIEETTQALPNPAKETYRPTPDLPKETSRVTSGQAQPSQSNGTNQASSV